MLGSQAPCKPCVAGAAAGSGPSKSLGRSPAAIVVHPLVAVPLGARRLGPDKGLRRFVSKGSTSGAFAKEQDAVEAGRDYGMQPDTHAVVIGGGVGGLVAARALLASGVDRVTQLDKDDLTTRVEGETLLQSGRRRSGNPQHLQPHLLLTGGKNVMEELMPGFIAELEAAGMEQLDIGADAHMWDWGAPYARGPTSIKAMSTNRRVLEQCLRDRVLADAGGRLRLRDSTRVAGFLWDEGCRSVLGVRLTTGEEVQGDVMVDSSGRSSATPRWLRDAGWSAPDVKVVDAHCVYASAHVTHPEGLPEGRKGLACWSRPWGRRNALIFGGETGTWQVILYGYEGDKAPVNSMEGYLDFAASLPDQTAYRFLQGATFLTPVMRYVATSNEQRQYDKVPMPPGLLVIGDAVQAVDPCYGQGMSVAAMAAKALGQEAGRALAGAPTAEARRTALRSLSATWQKTLARSNEPAWLMATGSDMRFPTAKIEGMSRPPALMEVYMDGLARLMHFDPAAFEAFFLVAYLVKPMSALFSPSLVLKVLWLLLRERLGLVPLPQPPQRAAGAASRDAASMAAEEAAAASGQASKGMHDVLPTTLEE
ncbi:hypothetical protein ABPG75_009875 [Micractinium tetrahymenae]